LSAAAADRRFSEPEQEQVIENVPDSLRASDGAATGGASRSSMLRGEKGKQISNCAAACITTCTRGCVAW
jgi:hypothetical protein